MPEKDKNLVYTGISNAGIGVVSDLPACRAVHFCT
jgi:hypothetical protein